jgi:hypothetical protein
MQVSICLMDKLLVELPNFVSHELCKKIIDKFENDDKKHEGFLRYKCGESIVNRDKFNTQLLIGELDNWKEINSEISKYMSKVPTEYLRQVYYNFNYDQEHHPYDRFMDIQSTRHQGCNIQRIKKGDKFMWHCDNSPNGKAFLQVILYLNTLDVHEGGCTEFSNGRMIRPEIGKILIFPCSWTFPHQGNEVKADVKYICTTVIHAEGWS